MGRAEDEFDESMRSCDELVDFDTSIEKRFYVLREREEGRNERVRLNGLAEFLPLSELRRGVLTNLNKEAFFVDAEGSYYPDFIEENGIYLVSAGFLEYLQEKLALGNIVYNTIGIVSEGGNRVEEYHLIIPDELDDAVLKENARYNKLDELEFFEIDEEKVGYLEIFRVKGFPHLIVTEKLNRIQFAGYECARIENFFDYEGERDRLYRERVSGERLQEAVNTYEKLGDATGDTDYKYGMRRVLDRYELESEIHTGLRSIFDSFRGETLNVELLVDRFYMFFWSWETLVISLAPSHEGFFDQSEIALKCLAKAKEFVEKLPEALIQPARQVCFEAVLYYLAKECAIFDRYPGIHENLRFRLYLHDIASNSMIPSMIYDYKNSFQREVEKAESLRGVNLSGKDLREFDFSGKNLSGVTIEGSDLRRAKFHRSILNGAVFKECELLGAEFDKAYLREVKLIDNNLEITGFDYADMQGAQILGSDLWHCSFGGSDLTKAIIRNSDLTYPCFYSGKLNGASLEISCFFHGVSFALCLMKDSKIIGSESNEECFLSECDFRNADLSGTKFFFAMIAFSSFIKTKLIEADFTHCGFITGTNYSWSSCAGMNFFGVCISDCVFRFVDLSQLKVKKGILLMDNDCSFSNLTGFDFSSGKYLFSNVLNGTDFCNCNLVKANLSISQIKLANFLGAKLENAIFDEKQLEDISLSSMQKLEIEIVST